jgi:hypothetical protein
MACAACAALLVEDFPTQLAEASRLLAPHVVVHRGDRAAFAPGGALNRRAPAGGSFARVGPWNIVLNWPRPPIWECRKPPGQRAAAQYAFDALEECDRRRPPAPPRPDHEVFPELTCPSCRSASTASTVQAIVAAVVAAHATLPTPPRWPTSGIREFAEGHGREARELHREAHVASRRRRPGRGLYLSALGSEMHSFDLAGRAALERCAASWESRVNALGLAGVLQPAIAATSRARGARCAGGRHRGRSAAPADQAGC